MQRKETNEGVYGLIGWQWWELSATLSEFLIKESISIRELINTVPKDISFIHFSSIVIYLRIFKYLGNEILAKYDDHI
jgi:hypothetical protein